MTTEEKLSFFYELINCNYALFRWEYDQNFQMLFTDWTNLLFSSGFLVYTGLEKVIRRHLETGSRLPVILEIEGNLLWICGFEQKNDELHTHLIGPIFSGRDSLLIIRRRMDSYDLSVKTRAAILKNFDSIPSIPSNIINQYAVMLHYCLTGEKLSADKIIYHSNTAKPENNTWQSDGRSHAGIWYQEQRLLKMISEGNPMYREALTQSHALSYGIKAEVGNALRSHKNNALVLLTLCSRACIAGGLSPSISYDLNDFYAGRIEDSDSMSAISALCSEMLEDYVARVRETKKQSHISSPILNSCYYIKTHIASPLSMEELAKRVGYTEYYFSHKFKKETGMSVNDFILNEKVEQAKLLLSDTGESIQAISDRLHFSGRSHFYTCFQKFTGMSPSEYRKRNGKL
ncbi:MAG: helix-turn-helix domain-containing protein [Marvinbryantia sp.]|uniref:helix-turn-helix domain-containing protein n=1 Tax=Marvinbryantia sp. TaxID=2496532 RepID=UPI0025E2F354|nr:AraC family transcriptional regulator [uncultured Marvinbryantia sp.]